MRIELPQDLYERLENRAERHSEVTPVDVIRQALDELDRYDQEVQALQRQMEALDEETVSAWQASSES